MLTIQVKKIVFAAAGSNDDEALAAGETPLPSSSAAAAGGVAPGASSGGGSTLHISGPVCSESQYVKMGAFHTLDLEVGRDFTLIKREGGWDSIGVDRVKEATEVGGGAEVGAIVCGDGACVAKFLDCESRAGAQTDAECSLQALPTSASSPSTRPS